MTRPTFTRLGYFIVFYLSAVINPGPAYPGYQGKPVPAASVSQTVGISTISVNYSRPSVKGRVVWGTLVPYGWDKQGFGLGIRISLARRCK